MKKGYIKNRNWEAWREKVPIILQEGDEPRCLLPLNEIAVTALIYVIKYVIEWMNTGNKHLIQTNLQITLPREAKEPYAKQAK